MLIASPCRSAGEPALVMLTYVSVSLLGAEDVDREIASILVRARRFNTLHAITGALLFTGRRFAQTLEGGPAVVDRLAHEIRRDPRHVAMRIIDRRDFVKRAFPAWTMAYAGPSVFVSRALERALTPGHSNGQVATARVLRLIAEFARQSAERSGS